MAASDSNFPFSINFNFHQSDIIHKGIFSHHDNNLSAVLPVAGNFFLSDDTAFLLSDGSNFLLS